MFPDIPESEWRWPHFSRAEMACRGTGECRMNPAFLDLLEKVRAEFGKPMTISSGYRSPEYNASISKTGSTGPHTTGVAIDIAIANPAASELLELFLAYPEVTGIGISQRQSQPRFIHIDIVHKFRTFWSY